MISFDNIQEIKIGNISTIEEDIFNEINGKYDKNHKKNSIDINNNDNNNDKKINIIEIFNKKNDNQNYKKNNLENSCILRKNDKSNENNIVL